MKPIHGDERDEWDDRLRTLFPDDLPPDRAVYILNTFEARDEGSDCWRTSTAYTGSHLDLQMQPRLEAQGMWRGRGFCTIVPSLWLWFRESEQRQFSVVLHEFTHYVVEQDAWREAAANHEFLRHLEQTDPEYIARILADAKERDRMRRKPPWLHHESQFIRGAIHVQYRALQAGHACSLAEMAVAGQGYELSNPWRYVEALGDECSRLHHEPVSEITKTPEPSAFAALWQRDTAWWEAGSTASGEN